jgi:hypothetical protein
MHRVAGVVVLVAMSAWTVGCANLSLVPRPVRSGGAGVTSASASATTTRTARTSTDASATDGGDVISSADEAPAALP